MTEQQAERIFDAIDLLTGQAATFAVLIGQRTREAIVLNADTAAGAKLYDRVQALLAAENFGVTEKLQMLLGLVTEFEANSKAAMPAKARFVWPPQA